MPKLSKNLLEKRFSCHHCGKSFRTRQGLSGHIQFKHDGGKKSSPIDFSYVISAVKRWEMLVLSAGMPMAQIKARQDILTNWLDVKDFCKFLHLELNQQDFKNFIIVSLACQNSEETQRKLSGDGSDSPDSTVSGIKRGS
jgi:hypothetical protein